MKRVLFFFSIVSLCLTFSAQAATVNKDGITITTELKDNCYETVATGLLNVRSEIVWDVITDFDHHADFMPNVIKSRVIKIIGDRHIIDKEVQFAFKKIHMVLESIIIIKSRILRWHQQKGPFIVNQGEWDIERISETSSRVTYRLQVKPNFFIPTWMRQRLTENNILKLFKAVETESIKRTDRH